MYFRFVNDIMFLLYNGPYKDMNYATKGRISLNLLINRKVGQNLISYIKGHNFG